MSDLNNMSKDHLEKLKQIGEILGIMEETHRDKKWILQEIKKYGPKVSSSPSINAYELLNSCTPDFVAKILRTLKGEDIERTKEDQARTKLFHWFFTDIVAGSNPTISTQAQIKKIIVLNEFISQTDTFKNKDPGSTIVLPTGDGMAIGFGSNPEEPLHLAMDLHKAIANYNSLKRGKDRLLIRVGLESGAVYFVKDLEGKDGVWGPGIITTRRVMDLCGDMQILASSRIADELVKVSAMYKKILDPIETYETKYGEKLQLYNIYGEGFGSKKTQTKKQKTNLQRLVKTRPTFSFNGIEILLDILDPKTMFSHHVWTWDLVNTSKEPKPQIFYYIDGHFPENLVDMNLSVTDNEDNKLEIENMILNKPHHKEFYVRLNKPILPKQRVRLKLQYDCLEPERRFFYRFPAGTKKFTYICTIPTETDLKNRILKVDVGTGYKIHATPPATIKRLNDRTVITWSKSNIVPQDAYQFEW